MKTVTTLASDMPVENARSVNAEMRLSRDDLLFYGHTASGMIERVLKLGVFLVHGNLLGRTVGSVRTKSPPLPAPAAQTTTLASCRRELAHPRVAAIA
jgi:hypothetical protein